ncbi:MAG: TonB-dependent receptor, partial [Hyphomonadaceae bacterium]|nr:TonB-dependent receptor [Hyphomonadaceae bacterium]
IYLSGGFDILPTFALFAEARASVRDFERNRAGATTNSLRVPSTHPDFVALTPGSTSMTLQYSFVDDLGNVIASGDNESLSFVAGLRSDIGSTWRIELAGQWGSEEGLYRNDNIVNAPRLNEALGLTNAIPTFNPAVDGYFNPFADGSNTPQNVLDFIRGWAETRYSSEMQGITLQADGELFTLPAGAVRLAIGAEYREESYGSRTVEFQSSLAPVLRQSPREERDVTAYYVEARVPIISVEQNVFGIHSLDLSLAARNEDTSNGGEETTPKIGILWSPFQGLMLRSSWGRSFRSPALTDTVSGSQTAFVFDLEDALSGTGTTTTLILQGTNPDLESERAESWTAGFTYQPSALEGFSFDFNVFRIDFQDRIASPTNPFVVLLNNELYGPIIIRDPDDALVQSYFDAPFYEDFGSTPPASDIGAIVDARLRNLSRSVVSGLDFDVGQSFTLSGFDLRASLSGSYIFEYEQAFSATGAVVDISDTANNPVDLRLRAGLNVNRGDWTGAFFINYTDDYTDTNSTPDRRVESWTTADVSLGYAFPDTSTLGGVQARLNVRNLFNEEPPFLNNPIGVGYDPENADPVGRFISFQITKTW